MDSNKPRPESNLVWAILSTLFCCLPFGIVSIVHAAKVDNLYNTGDYEGAQEASTKARNWAIYSMCAVLPLFLLGVIIALVYRPEPDNNVTSTGESVFVADSAVIVNSDPIYDSSSTYYLRGRIGNLQVTMQLQFDGTENVRGWYYYNSQGPSKRLDLNGTWSSGSNKLYLHEYDGYGNVTGLFKGYWNANSRNYHGIFLATETGREFAFEIEAE